MGGKPTLGSNGDAAARTTGFLHLIIPHPLGTEVFQQTLYFGDAATGGHIDGNDVGESLIP
jgi:hypothetical protein